MESLLGHLWCGRPTVLRDVDLVGHSDLQDPFMFVW
jgi:hypothetical protein